MFSGIGGLETGLSQAGMTIAAVAEIDRFANRVLGQHLPEVPNLGDVEQLSALPDCDVLAAGFPCQDLSQAGRMTGIHGTRSGLIKNVLEAVERSAKRPAHLLFENVPFLLKLQRGAGMEWLVGCLESLGYRWAYRIIDTRAFGLAQRRRRLFVLASMKGEPARLLFDGNRVLKNTEPEAGTPVGFYWTEGNTGIGWAPDAIPPLKSTALVVSAPAIWRPQFRDFVTPTIEDAEALQGLDRGWTKAVITEVGGNSARWRLVGNAVSVPCAKWIGERIVSGHEFALMESEEFPESGRWPNAAFGGPVETRRCVQVGEFPGDNEARPIGDFLSEDAPKLSLRAAGGFLRRLERSSLHVPEHFRSDLRNYVRGPNANDGHGSQPSNAKHQRTRQPA
jgi:DNA (cytosine-5)-methyltransferase 1